MSAFEEREVAKASEEAAAIGGDPGPSGDGVNEADRPLKEAGQGEAEGFEAAEEALIDHASHGDQHAARRVLEDAPVDDEDARAERHEDARPADR